MGEWEAYKLGDVAEVLKGRLAVNCIRVITNQ